MILGKRKPLERIFEMLAPYENILIVGCGTCMTVCMAGGLKEAEETVAALRLRRQQEGRPVEVQARAVERQCEPEYLELLDAELDRCEAVLSLACGVGVQYYSLFRPEKVVLPGLDTCGCGYPVEQGTWQESCLCCGDCLLDRTGGICPLARCPKGMQNGPCGGMRDGKCELDPASDCAWVLIYNRLESLGKLDLMDEIRPPKDWSKAFFGGPRRIEREDVKPDEIE